MALVTTEAVVLHAFDYMESSRIYRLLTRDRGLQSALAKGARRARGKVGSSVDLFAQGEVQLYIKPGRELHNVAAFDVSRSRASLATVQGRFTAAAALAELVLRFMQALDIGADKVNVNGGAIAMGHPLGATGAMNLGTALDELERAGKSTALITLCIGGGMGTATIIERV